MFLENQRNLGIHFSGSVPSLKADLVEKRWSPWTACWLTSESYFGNWNWLIPVLWNQPAMLLRMGHDQDCHLLQRWTNNFVEKDDKAQHYYHHRSTNNSKMAWWGCFLPVPVNDADFCLIDVIWHKDFSFLRQANILLAPAGTRCGLWTWAH